LNNVQIYFLVFYIMGASESLPLSQLPLTQGQVFSYCGFFLKIEIFIKSNLYSVGHIGSFCL